MSRTEFLEQIACFQIKAPVHVVPIAESLNVPIYKNFDFPNNLSGLIKREDDDSYSIHVNGNHPSTRQRFTMAHELAHFVLHKDQIGDGITDDYLYRSGMSNAAEREANQLAADILMPRHLLTSEHREGMTVDQLADLFWVSRMSMDIRLGEIVF